MAKNWKSFVTKDKKVEQQPSDFEQIPISHNDLKEIAKGNENIKELLDERTELESKMDGLVGSSSEKIDPRFVPAAITSISERKKQFAEWQKKRKTTAQKASERKATDFVQKKKEKKAKQGFDTQRKKDLRKQAEEKKKLESKKQKELKDRKTSTLSDKDTLGSIDRPKRIAQKSPFGRKVKHKKSEDPGIKNLFEKKKKSSTPKISNIEEKPVFEPKDRKRKQSSKEVVETKKSTKNTFRNKLGKPQILKKAEDTQDQFISKRDKLKENKILQLVAAKEKGAIQNQLKDGVEKIEEIEKISNNSLGGITPLKNKLEDTRKSVGKIEDKWDDTREKGKRLFSVKDAFADKRRNLIKDKEDADKLFDRRDFLNKIRLAEIKDGIKKAKAVAQLIQEKKEKKKEEEKPDKVTENKQDKGMSTDDKDASKTDPKEKEQDALSNQIDSDALYVKSKKKEAMKESRRTRKKKNKGLEV